MTIPLGYDAARAGAAFLVRRGRGKIAVAGSDRQAYLHAMLTNDILALQPGTGCYAAYLTPQGRMITDVRVFEIGDLTLLEMRAAEAPTVLAKLDQFIFTEDVKLGDLGEAFEEVRVAGPAAAGVVAAALRGKQGAAGGLPAEGDLAVWPEFRNVRASILGEMVLVAATRDLGVPGFDLFVERLHAGRLEEAIAAAGAVPLSEEAEETLRIEAGSFAFGRDMDGETIPLEAGIEARAISFTKGCYPGQEVIVRVLHRGHGRVARRLCGVLCEGTHVPTAGDALRSGVREAGRVTSAAWSPMLEKPIALAWVQRDFVAPGTELTVVHGEEPLAAKVVPLPFEKA
jgi:folate-binding protein YgfZ